MTDQENRQARRAATARQRRAMRTGKWAPWERRPSPKECGAKSSGWFQDLDRAWRNGIYAVMARTLVTAWGEVEHVCIRNIDNSDVPWRDKQRIKDELFGEDRVAIEVFPPRDELVDGADMYHLWVLPRGMTVPFSFRSRSQYPGFW